MVVPPVSIKGVVLNQGRVLLLLNERDEWDLPGGRPDPGEDHRSTLAREVREEAGLEVEVGAFLDEHLFEVLPQRFVRIVAYACRLDSAAAMPVALISARRSTAIACRLATSARYARRPPSPYRRATARSER